MPRQTKFDRLMAVRDNFLEEVTNYCLLGCTNDQLDEFFGQALGTAKHWLQSNPTFAKAVEAGRIQADARVARAMLRKAEGFSMTTQQLVTVGQGKGVSEVEVHEVETYFPPDTSAGKFWLTNRNRNWRDKQAHEHTGANGQAIQTDININFIGIDEKPLTLTNVTPTIEQDPAND